MWRQVRRHARYAPVFASPRLLMQGRCAVRVCALLCCFAVCCGFGCGLHVVYTFRDGLVWGLARGSSSSCPRFPLANLRRLTGNR